MATQPSEEQGNLNRAEPAADIENVSASIGSASSQSGGASENSKEEVDVSYYRPLLQAAFRGDWEFATRFFNQDAASKTAKTTSRSETLLHIAALSAQDQFLENLVVLLSPHPEALEMVDCDGRAALHNAVLCGRIRMVKALVRSNPKLTQIADKDGRVPLGISALEASMHKEIVWFLAKNTTDDEPSHPFSSPDAIETFIDLTYAGHHDITLYLLEWYPHLMTMKGTKREDRSILFVLAMTTSHFRSGTKLSVLEALIYKCIPVDLNYKPTDKNLDRVTKFSSQPDAALQSLSRSLWNAAKTGVPTIKRVHEKKLGNVAAVELARQVCIAISRMSTTEITNFFKEGDLLFQATSTGISEIVKLCIQFFPELNWVRPYGRSLPTHAVEFRQERTLGLFLKLSSTGDLSLVPRPTTQDSAKLMVAVASCRRPGFNAVNNMVGSAFNMQREIQWYKAVESWVIPYMKAGYISTTQGERMPCLNAFVENHKDLFEKGEKWVKDTANSCMLVSTLIATVLFAAAFTMPGGNNDKTGVPLLLGKDSLLIFAISDALGLLSSVTAILLFLAILTSRYEPQDFLKSLPKKIIMGLVFLFLSLAFMLVGFAAALTIALDKRLEWILIPIILLTSIPVALFLVLQLPLLYQMVKSTYGPSIFHPESIWE